MRVLIVDDSAMMRTLLRDFLTAQGEIVAGDAPNGKKAVEMTEELDPDLILMDIDMPVMNGIEASREILSRKRRPLIIISHDITGGKAEALFEIGASEVWEKPSFVQFEDPRFSKDFITKMRLIVEGFQHLDMGDMRPLNYLQRNPRPSPPEPKKPSAVHNREKRETSGGAAGFRCVVMGASTGGPEAVRRVLSALPADFPLPLLLVQHIEARFAAGYASWLDGHCLLPVEQAPRRGPLAGGRIYTAPADQHLILEEDHFAWEDSAPVKNQKPAVERLFLSAARSLGSKTLGVLLTGMGSDGADGARAIKEAGGHMIIQDKKTSFIFGMPKAAIEGGGASEILPLEEIGAALIREAGS